MTPSIIPAQSPQAQAAHSLFQQLQSLFVQGLQSLPQNAAALKAVTWLRDGGRHGGGLRYSATDTALFNNTSVNVSQVHYDDQPHKALGSASALSCIIHPQHPLAPSLHLHLSWTEFKSGPAYWRLMADLNPANPTPAQQQVFEATLQAVAPSYYAAALAQGEQYFYIPVLQRHRGLSHFYLEAHHSGDFQADYKLAEHFAEAVLNTYLGLVRSALQQTPSPAQAAQQLAYHSLYLFQVLTLDRGTTSGLLAHDQNDLGIMGSLPARVDPVLLQSWLPLMPAPQDQLLQAILKILNGSSPFEVGPTHRQALAQAVRSHYQRHPEALKLQATGQVRPPGS